MRIDNRTWWRSDQIMAIARKVAETELDPEKRGGFTVLVRYGHRGGATSGHAPYGGRWIHVNVGSDAVDTVNLAHTLAHEMAHTRGTRHRQMFGSVRYTYVDGWREHYAWAAGMPVEKKPAKATPPLDAKRAERIAHCLEKITQWERRKLRATNKVKVWTRRLKATEQRVKLAASQPPKETTA